MREPICNRQDITKQREYFNGPDPGAETDSEHGMGTGPCKQ